MPAEFLTKNALPFLLLISFFFFPNAHGQASNEAKGAVCTGIYAPFFPSQGKHSVYITVGDSKKLYFDHADTVVLDNLDLHKTYLVRIFESGEQTDSRKLRFDRLKVHMVTIWRSPGYWHMDPNPSGKCGKR